MKINIYDIIFWIFFILAIIFFLWYLFGDSPTLEQALLILIIGVLFKIQSDITINRLEIKNVKTKFGNMEKSFIRLVDDFKDHLVIYKKH